MLRIAPVDRIQKICAAVSDTPPPTAHRHRPKRLDLRAGATTEHKDAASKRISPEAFLHQHRQALHAFACQCDPSRPRFLRLLRSGSSLLQKVQHSSNAVISTPLSAITREPLPTIISIRPLAGVVKTDGAGDGSGITIAGTKPG